MTVITPNAWRARQIHRALEDAADAAADRSAVSYHVARAVMVARRTHTIEGIGSCHVERVGGAPHVCRMDGTPVCPAAVDSAGAPSRAANGGAA